MSFTSLKDFKELRGAIKCCEDPDIGCEDCPFINIEGDCTEHIEQGEQKAIVLAIKYLEKQEKRKRKHG